MNIREIAEIVGVSSATVSRVINNSGNVKEETRQKVLAAIEKYNYVPSQVARSLSTNDTSIIGVIIPDIENPFFSSVIRGISEVAEQNKYNIMFFGTNETPSIEHSYLQIALAERLKGVIITPISENDKHTRDMLIRLKQAGVPVVLVDRDISNAEFDGVFIDNEAGAYQGVKALIDEGHRKIGIIKGPSSSKPGRDRFLGYLRAMEDGDLKVRDEYIAKGNFKIDMAYERTKELLSLNNPPTAIFTSNNFTTIGCLRALTELDLTIGQDISVIGFDEVQILNDIDYKLSVIERDATLQGREAMNILLTRLEEKEKTDKYIKKILPHRIILRGSEKIRTTNNI